MERIMKIGKSNLILDYYQGETEYSDGSVEDDILKRLRTGDAQTEIKKLLNKGPSWPLKAHLLDERRNLLSWYEFKKDSSLLEIGSGWGALTGLFCEKVDKVTAVELTKKRAEITAFRHKDEENLTVIAGNIDNIKTKEKFDYVTSIGVLEYAGKYTNSENPYYDFLEKLKSFLKPNGVLIIAIENKFGLKYWAGANEDHAGSFFESIEDYPIDRGIKTFTKKEITKMLEKAGFGNIKFYYPLPDYKLPTEIFSDEYLPTFKHNIRSGMMPYPDYVHEREIFFNEKLASDNIIKNGNFDFFANSFLIFATRRDK